VFFRGLRHSPTLRQDICQFFFNQIAITVNSVRARDVRFIWRTWDVALLLSSWVYLKFCVQFGGFSWATHDWSRGWNSRPGDGVKTCRPRHLQRSCPLDNHSKICQLSVLSTWLITWVLLAHTNPPAVMRDFLSTNTLLFSILQFSAALSDSSDFCPRGKDLDLDGNASWKFWVSISFKSQAGIFLGFATLEKNTYGSILMIGHRRFTVVNRLWTLFMPSSRSQHAPSATSEMLGSITYCSATWVRISNTHRWRFWRCWSRYKCSTGSFVWARGVVSALFESCCWSEYIGIWFDGFR